LSFHIFLKSKSALAALLNSVVGQAVSPANHLSMLAYLLLTWRLWGALPAHPPSLGSHLLCQALGGRVARIVIFITNHRQVEPI
jgi:hypothetical protein